MKGLLIWASTLSLAATLSSGDAHAQERVVVLTLSAQGGGEAGNFAASMTRALRDAAAVVSGWEVHDAGGDTVESRGCAAPDLACAQQIAEELDAARVVFGTVAPEPPDAMRVTVTSYERGAAALSEPVSDVIPPAEQSDADLRGAAEGLWATLAGPAYQPEPEPLDEDAAFAEEPPEAPPAETTATTAGFTADVQAEPAPSRRPWDDERTPIAIGLIAAGGVLLAGSIYAAVRVNELQDDAAYQRFRARVPAGRDVCDELDDGNTWGADPPEAQRAEAVCDEGGALSVLGVTFLAAGVLAAAGGTALLLSLGGGPEQEQVSLTPQVGPRGAALSASMRF